MMYTLCAYITHFRVLLVIIVYIKRQRCE